MVWLPEIPRQRWGGAAIVALVCSNAGCTSDLREQLGGPSGAGTGAGREDAGPGAAGGSNGLDSSIGPDLLKLIASVPAPGATGVSVATQIELQFEREVTLGTGNIVIRRALDDSEFAAFSATSSQVLLDGGKLIIDLHPVFGGETQYYVALQEGALNVAGIPSPRFGGPEQLMFTTEPVSVSPGVTRGLVGWFDAAYPAAFKTQEDAVTAWGDRSGAGRSVEAAVPEKRPNLLPMGPNGLSTVEFNGMAGLAGTPVLEPGDETISIFTVWRADTHANQVIWDQDAKPSSVGSRASLVTTANGTFGFSGNSNDFKDAHSYAETAVQLSVLRMNGSNELGIVNNGELARGNISIATLDYAAGGLAFGESYAAEDEGLDGAIAEALFFDRVLSFPEEQAVQRYLAEKWAVELVGPSLVSSMPENEQELVSQDTDIVLTFDRNVQAGEGDLIVLRAEDDQVIERVSTSSPAVVFSGPQMTVAFPNLLAGTTRYYVAVEGGSVEDEAGAPFIGFADSTALSFTVDDVVPAGLSRNLVLWLDAAYPSSLVVTDGKVVSWLDRSGKGHNAVQSEAPLQPLLVEEAIGAKSVVGFGRGTDSMLSTRLRLDPSAGFEVQATVRFDASTAEQETLLFLPLGSGAAQPVLYRAAGTADLCAFIGPEGACVVDGIDFTYQLISLHYDGTTLRLFVHGTEVQTQAVAISANDSFLMIGAEQSTNYFRGDIAEMFIFDRDMSASDILPVEDAMAEKWQVPLER